MGVGAVIRKGEAMTERIALLALAQRCERAAEPDVILDQDIAIALGWTLKKRGKEKRAWWRDPEGRKRTPPRFSAVAKASGAILRAKAAMKDPGS